MSDRLSRSVPAAVVVGTCFGVAHSWLTDGPVTPGYVLGGLFAGFVVGSPWRGTLAGALAGATVGAVGIGAAAGVGDPPFAVVAERTLGTATVHLAVGAALGGAFVPGR